MRAAWIAGEILDRFPNDIKSFNLVPGGHGQLDLFFNEELVYSHQQRIHISDPGARFLDAREVGQMVKDWRAKIGRPVTKSVGSRADISEDELGLNPNDPQLARKGPSVPGGPSS